MAAWGRMLWAIWVLLMPGGFVMVLAYLLWRTVKERYRQAAAQGREVSLWQVLGTVHVRDVVHQARAAF